MDNQVYTDEINLYDYLKIIYKWKFLIIALCLISVAVTFIITGIITSRKPTTYKITALLSPGSLSYTPDGKEIPIDSATNVQAVIQSGLLNTKIIETLKLDPAQYSGMQFTTQIPKDSEVIRVFYDTPDPEKGKMIVSEMINQLSVSYKNRLVLNRETVSKQIDKLKNTLMLQQNKKERLQAQKYRTQNQNERLQTQQEDLNNKKERLQNQQERLQNKKDRLQSKKDRKNNEKNRAESNSELMHNKLALLIASEKNIQELLKKAEDDMNTLSIEKNGLLKKGDKTDTAFLVFYSNTIQQAIYRIDKLRSDLQSNRLEQASIKTDIAKNKTIVNDLDTEINDIDTEVNDLDTEANDIDTQIRDIAVSMKTLDIQKKDVDSQIKDFITQEKDIDIENLPTLKEIENIAKTGTLSSESIKVLQEPIASINTVEIRRGKKVAVAGITALFIGIMLAFFIEYINKMRRAAG